MLRIHESMRAHADNKCIEAIHGVQRLQLNAAYDMYRVLLAYFGNKIQIDPSVKEGTLQIEILHNKKHTQIQWPVVSNDKSMHIICFVFVLSLTWVELIRLQ